MIYVLFMFTSNAEDEEREQLAKEISQDWSSGIFIYFLFCFPIIFIFILKLARFAFVYLFCFCLFILIHS